MKKLVLSFLVATLLSACNNQADTSTDNTRTDTSTVEQDNTINRDTGYMSTDTMNRRDTARP